MTDKQWQELGRRAVACKGWRWVPGMLAKGGHWPPARIIATRDNECEPPEVELAWSWDRGDGGNPTGLYPDLRDAATLGCLLGLVRLAWGDSGASVWHDRRAGVWSWMADGCIHGVWRPSDADGYETEAEALVAALEAADD